MSSPSFLDGSVIKNPPAMKESCIQSLGGEDPLEEGIAPYSSILAWRIPRVHPTLQGKNLLYQGLGTRE